MSIRDRGLKDVLIRHYWAQGAFVQPEVEIFNREGVSEPAKALTDVDVFVLLPSSKLTFQKVLADCRTLKGQSPIARALWLAGLMRYMDADSGCVLLGSRDIEIDHKLAASNLGVLLVDASDFDLYDKAILYPEGSGAVPVGVADFERIGAIGVRFPSLRPLMKYLHTSALTSTDVGGVIRKILGEFRGVARELDPSRAEHHAFIHDVAAVFSVRLASCAGDLFHQYLQPARKDDLVEALKTLVWGGREQYAFFQTVRKKLVEARQEGAQASGDLTLPAWDTFVQLMRELLESPNDAFVVPLILRTIAIDIARGTPPLGYAPPRVTTLSLKFAMLAGEYVCKAGGVPKEFQAALSAGLVKLQGDYAARRSRAQSPQEDVTPAAARRPSESANISGEGVSAAKVVEPRDRLTPVEDREEG